MRKYKRSFVQMCSVLLVFALFFTMTGCQAKLGDAAFGYETEEGMTLDTNAAESTAEVEEVNEETFETDPPTESATEPSTEATEEQANVEETTPVLEDADDAENAEAKPDCENPEDVEEVHEHSYFVADVVDPGCVTDGYVLYLCSCGDYHTEVMKSRGYHDWLEWTTVKEATTESEGLKQRCCWGCDATETKTISKLPAEPKPTEPKPTEPKPTEPPKQEPVETQPPVTEPPVTEPPVTEPPVTEPPASEPPKETEPAGCQHSWNEVHHAEEGHEEHYVICDCGARFKTTSEWSAHSNSYSNAEALMNHGGHGSADIYVVDSPAYTEWVCSKCGAVTTSHP